MSVRALVARAAGFALVAFFILGPLTSLAVWSVTERWTYPSAWPQAFGLRYWSRVASGDFLEPLRLGVFIAVIVTLLALAMAIPLGYALARLAFPGRTLVLLLFLLPQAFPQLPVFASATREFYRFGLAGTITGVVLVHLVGGLVFAVWTMTAVFRSIGPELEEAAWNLGASTTRAFASRKTLPRRAARSRRPRSAAKRNTSWPTTAFASISRPSRWTARCWGCSASRSWLTKRPSPRAPCACSGRTTCSLRR